MRFQHCGGVLVLAGWIVLGSFPAAQQTPVFPFVVERIWIEPADPQTNSSEHISYTVHNRGDRTITAFGVRAEIRLADGTTTVTSTAVDRVTPWREDNPDVLRPGGRFTGRMGLVPPPNAVDVAGTPSIVVFDDDTAFGDEALLGAIFAGRAKNQCFWRLLHQIVSDVAQRFGDPDAALRAIDTDLEAAADAELRETGMYVEIRRRISFDTMYRLNQDPRKVLQDLAKQAATGMAKADAHARRRRPGAGRG